MLWKRNCSFCIPWAGKTTFLWTHQTLLFASDRLLKDPHQQKYWMVVKRPLLLLRRTLISMDCVYWYQSPSILGPGIDTKTWWFQKFTIGDPYKPFRGHNNAPNQTLEYDPSNTTIGTTIGGLQRKWWRKEIWLVINFEDSGDVLRQGFHGANDLHQLKMSFNNPPTEAAKGKCILIDAWKGLQKWFVLFWQIVDVSKITFPSWDARHFRRSIQICIQSIYIIYSDYIDLVMLYWKLL